MHAPTIREKMEWVFGPGRKTELAAQARYSRSFLHTSSQLTAAILRYRYNKRLFWQLVRESKPYGALFEYSPHFQASVIILYDSSERIEYHVFHVSEDVIYQSIDGESEWNVRPFIKTIGLASESRSLTAKELMQLTGVRIGHDQRCIIEWYDTEVIY